MDNKAFIKKHPFLKEMWKEFRKVHEGYFTALTKIENKYNKSCIYSKGIKTVELFWVDGGVVGIGINHYEKEGKKLIHDSDLEDL